jgi:hypothetical protein
MARSAAELRGLRGVMREVRLALGDMLGGKPDPSHDLMLRVLFGLLGSLARADGLVSTEEADYTNALMEELDLGCRRQVELEQEMQRFLITFPHGSSEVDRLYDSLLRLAAADRRIRPGERQFLDRVTHQLGYRPEVLEQRLNAILV